MIINRLSMPISMARAIEDAQSEIAREKADVDYIAMMSGIELDDEEDNLNE